MKIKNIIFDLGAVIIDIDYNRTAEAFKKLGIHNFDELYSKKKQDHFFDSFEKGTLTNEQFRSEVRNHLPASTSDAQIDSAWNAMLIGIPPARYKWLEKIGQQYWIFLLSNTNRIHITAFSELIDRDYGIKKFEALFIKVYYSCNAGMRKPDAEIFELVVNENNLSKNETVFIDDSIHHIEGAKKFGLNTLHLQDNMTVEELTAQYISN